MLLLVLLTVFDSILVVILIIIYNFTGGRKLLGQECLADGLENECAFHFSESASPTLRTLAVYRDEQLKTAGIFL